MTISLNSPATSRMSLSFPKGFPATFLDDFTAFPLELVGRIGSRVLASYRVSIRAQKFFIDASHPRFESMAVQDDCK